MVGMQKLLEEMTRLNASDLHLTAGSPPRYRIDGKLLPSKYEKLKPARIKELTYSVLNEKQKKKFEMDKELDFSFGIPGVSRFRANLFLQRGSED